MVSRDLIIQFLDGFLEIDKFEDKILNGLQVIGKNEIKKIAFGVTASLELFEKAVKANADMVITHHGLINDWDEKCIYELKKQRLKVLFDNNMNHLAYHLPLDAHYDSGNNVQLITKLGLEFKEMFFGSPPFGVIAQYQDPKDINEIVKDINAVLNVDSRLLKFGKDKVKTVAAVSGSGGSAFLEAIEKNVDLFITGDSKESNHELAKESKTNIIFAGHYNSEKLGVMALAELIKDKFNIETEFIDVPNVL